MFYLNNPKDFADNYILHLNKNYRNNFYYNITDIDNDNVEEYIILLPDFTENFIFNSKSNKVSNNDINTALKNKLTAGTCIILLDLSDTSITATNYYTNTTFNNLPEFDSTLEDGVLTLFFKDDITYVFSLNDRGRPLYSEPSIYLDKSATDNEIIEFVEDNYTTWVNTYGFISMGAYFNIDYEREFINKNPSGIEYWYAVDDPRVTCVKDIVSFCQTRFSKHCNIQNILNNYQDVNGALYSSCLGIGFESWWEYEFDKIIYDSPTHVTVYGTEYTYDEYTQDISIRNVKCTLVLENDMWMCEST